MEALTLGQWQDHEENADAIPTGFPEDSVNVDQIEHLLDHLVGSRPPLVAELGARIGVELIVNINLVLVVLVYVVVQGIQGLAVLVDAEAGSPNDKRHGKESAGDTKRVGLSILRSKKTSDEFVMFDDGTCLERNKGGWHVHMRSGWQVDVIGVVRTLQ